MTREARPLPLLLLAAMFVAQEDVRRTARELLRQRSSDEAAARSEAQ